MTGHEFTCANCGVTFESSWSHEDAIDEMLDTISPDHFTEHPNEPIEVVCDDCHNLIIDRIRREAPHLLRPEAR